MHFQTISIETFADLMCETLAFPSETVDLGPRCYTYGTVPDIGAVTLVQCSPWDDCAVISRNGVSGEIIDRLARKYADAEE